MSATIWPTSRIPIAGTWWKAPTSRCRRPIDPEKLVRREPRGPLGYFWFGTPEDIAQRIRGYSR